MDTTLERTLDRNDTPLRAAVHPVLTGVFGVLEQRRVRCALLRVPSVSSSGITGDIDVLVHPADVSQAGAVFRSLGFLRLPRSGTHFLRYDAHSDAWLWFHLVHELTFHGAIESDAALACLARRVTGAEPPRLAPDDEFWVLLLHCVLDKRRVAAHHQDRLKILAAHNPADGPLAEFMARLCAPRSPAVTPASIAGMAARGEWSTVERIVWDLAGEWQSTHRATVWRRQRDRGVRLRHAIRRATRYRGLGVAVLGPDGAGKSTLAAALASSFQLPVRVMYMGLTGGALKYAARLRVPGVVFAARAAIIWQRYLRARIHQMRGRLVVFDRYVLDAAVPHPRRLNRVELLARRLDGHLCPSPDLVLVLDAPGDVMHRRKGEYTADVLDDWRRHFLALQHQGAHVEVIDATQDKDAVRIEATDRIWRRYQARWGSV